MELEHSKTNKTAEMQSRAQSIRDLLIFLGREMDWARAWCGPEKSIGSETAAVWVAEWEPLARKHGKEKFHEALRNGLKKKKGFIPTPGEIEAELAGHSVENLGGFISTPEQDNCAICGGSGWKDVTKPVDKNRSVTRCECRRQAAEKQGK